MQQHKEEAKTKKLTSRFGVTPFLVTHSPVFSFSLLLLLVLVLAASLPLLLLVLVVLGSLSLSLSLSLLNDLVRSMKRTHSESFVTSDAKRQKLLNGGSSQLVTLTPAPVPAPCLTPPLSPSEIAPMTCRAKSAMPRFESLHRLHHIFPTVDESILAKSFGSLLPAASPSSEQASRRIERSVADDREQNSTNTPGTPVILHLEDGEQIATTAMAPVASTTTSTASTTTPPPPRTPSLAAMMRESSMPGDTDTVIAALTEIFPDASLTELNRTVMQVCCGNRWSLVCIASMYSPANRALQVRQ
jgi:hypothetical protein